MVGGSITFNQTIKYGLRSLAFLAQHPGKRVNAQDIAAATGVPRSYLSKILRMLSRKSFVQARKGISGGFSLRPAARSRRITDVIVALQATKNDSEPCLLGLDNCSDREPCPVYDQWKNILRLKREFCEKTTVGMLGELFDEANLLATKNRGRR